MPAQARRRQRLSDRPQGVAARVGMAPRPPAVREEADGTVVLLQRGGRVGAREEDALAGPLTRLQLLPRLRRLQRARSQDVGIDQPDDAALQRRDQAAVEHLHKGQAGVVGFGRVGCDGRRHRILAAGGGGSLPLVVALAGRNIKAK